MGHKSEELPLLSIVIATRNRISYCISAIESILQIVDPRLELVVQDNSDSRDLELYVLENFQDRRLCYQYTPGPFSSIDNFNAAVKLARGEYLCLIGDDDGVNPEIVEAAAWAKANGIDALTPGNICSYFWSNTGLKSTLFAKVEGPQFSIVKFSGKTFEVDLRREITKLFRNGGLYYLSYHFPKFYHGLVHRRCLEEIHEKTGYYVGGLSADIFSALAIACVAKRVMFLDYPLTIPGMCKVSGSIVEGQVKKHSKRLEDAPHFRDRGEYHWCALVPRIYSVETIWADSGIAALRAMGRDDLVKELNLPKLAAYCVLANRGVARPVLNNLFQGLGIMQKNPVIGVIKFVWCFLIEFGLKFFRRVKNRFLMIIGIRAIHRINGLENMVKVSQALSHYLKENGYSFSNCVRVKVSL